MNKWFNKFNKLTKVFIVIGMIFSMCFSAGNTTSVEAWDNTIPHEFIQERINSTTCITKKITLQDLIPFIHNRKDLFLAEVDE